MCKSVVSVIIPVYNVEKYLDKCVMSVLEQSYNNLEILLIDDGSTDTSGEICDSYVKKDARIKVFHKVNTGLGLTRNYGIERANGNYIFFVDSDDWIDKNIIEIMVKRAEKENVDFITCGYEKISDTGNILYTEKYEEEQFDFEEVRDKLLPRLIGSLPDKRDSIFTTVWCNLYKKDLIIKNNIRFHSEREYQSEDLLFQLDYLPYAQKTVVLSCIGYYYRTNLSSLAQKYKANRFEESKKVYYYVYNKIQEEKLPETTYLRLSKMLFVSLRQVIKQEHVRVNNKNYKQCISEIKKIVNDDLVKKVINDYPVNKLKLNQYVFIKLIEYKKVNLLYLLTKGR